MRPRKSWTFPAFLITNQQILLLSSHSGAESRKISGSAGGDGFGHRIPPHRPLPPGEILPCAKVQKSRASKTTIYSSRVPARRSRPIIGFERSGETLHCVSAVLSAIRPCSFHERRGRGTRAIRQCCRG